MTSDSGPTSRGLKLLRTLEQLLTIDATSLVPAMDHAAQFVVEALSADKVDIFLFHPESNTLQAMGVSNTPMGRRQLELGLDRLSLADGGLAASVYLTGKSVVTGRADREPGELQSLVKKLGVRSEIICPLTIAGERRGVLQVLSAHEEYFREQEDLSFIEAVSHWVGIVAHRAELVERLATEAAEAGRREALDDLMSLLTPRQREVAELIASGLTNEQIANRLFIATGSVANHVERIMQRLGAERRTQIAAWTAASRARPGRADGQESGGPVR